jgi:hypothetical protein
LLAFCGYVLILLIEKVLFSNVSLDGEEQESALELKDIPYMDKLVANRHIPQETPKDENTPKRSSVSPGKSQNGFRFLTFKSDVKLINIDNDNENVVAHSRKNSQKINSKLSLEDIQNFNSKGKDKKEKEFKKIFSNFGQISSIAKERCKI